jgi:hypothetical protein
MMDRDEATALAVDTLQLVSPGWRAVKALHDGESWNVTLEPTDGGAAAMVRVMDDGSADVLTL